MNIQIVPTHMTAQLWPKVEPFIEGAEKYAEGDYSIDQMKMYVTQGTWALFVATDDDGIKGAMTVAFQSYPNDRIAFVTCTGGKFICTKESLDQLKRHLTAMGATKIQAGGRDSVFRMLQGLGFKKRYTVVETTIGE